MLPLDLPRDEKEKKLIPIPYSLSFSQRCQIAYVVDLETTGKDDSYRLEILTLSISAINRTGKIDELELQMRPETNYWEEGAEEKHKISRFEASRFGERKEETEKLLAFLEKHGPGILVCHALWFGKYFDSTVILNHLDKMGLRHTFYKYFIQSQSTLTWMRFLGKLGVYQFEELNLEYLCKYFGIKLDHHNAQSDREACEALFRIVLSQWDKFEDQENGLWLSFANCQK